MNSSPTVSPLCTPLNGYSEAHSSRPSRLTELIFSLYEHFSFYYTAAFVPLGLVLNVLVLLVFLLPHRRRPRAFGAHREQSMVRRRSVASSTTRLYYMMMACGELGALLFKDIWIFFLSSGIDTLLGAGAGRSSSSGYRSGNMTVSGSEIGTGPGAEAGGFLGPANAHRSAAACSLALFLSYVHELTANNVLIVFEIERVIVLYQPFVARKWLSHSRAFSIVALVVISDVAVCAGSFQSSRIINVQLPLSSNQQRSEAHVNDMDGAGVQLEFRFMKLCILSSSVPFWNAWAAFVFFATFVWPAVVSFVCSALITFKIVRHQHIQRELSEHLRVQRMHNTQSLHQQYISMASIVLL